MPIEYTCSDGYKGTLNNLPELDVCKKRHPNIKDLVIDKIRIKQFHTLSLPLQLESLTLANNRLKLQTLKNVHTAFATTLKKLVIINNNIYQIHELPPALETLELIETRIQQIKAPWPATLKRLVIKSNLGYYPAISEIEHPFPPGIEHITINNTEITSIKDLHSGYPNLEHLDLGFNCLTLSAVPPQEIFSEKYFPKLRYLDIRQNRFGTEGMGHRTHPMLFTLKIDRLPSIKITSPFLEHLNLGNIGIVECADGTWPKSLKTLSCHTIRSININGLPDCLESLNLDGCDITEIDRFPANLKSLKINGSSDAFRHIPAFPPEIRNVYIHGCPIEDPVINYSTHLKDLLICRTLITRMPDLFEGINMVILDHNRITSDGLVEFPSTLEWLVLSHNHLTRFPDRLPPNIKTLYVGDNRISELPERLPENLEHFGIDHNCFSRFPEQIFNLRRLNMFSWNGNPFQTIQPNYPEISERIEKLIAEGMERRNGRRGHLE